MKMRKLFLLAGVALSLAACDKSSTKFRVGDKVRLKLDRSRQGVVWLRMSPFVDDQYYLKVPGKKSDLTHETAYGNEPPWWIDGPYGDIDLELVARR
jgi:hypothetical protein